MKKRLQKLMELAEGQTVADVGCDHGYLCEMLTKTNFREISACEVTSKNLHKAKTNITNYVYREFENVENLENKLVFGDKTVSFVLSDGLDNLQKIPDCVIIAGMGGELIANILFKNLEKLPKVVVLQPMSKFEFLRKELSKHYEIMYDSVLYDCGKYYNVIKAKRGECELNELELLFGKTNLKELTPEFKQYLSKLKNNFQKIKTKEFNDLLLQIEKVEELYE